MNLLRGIILTTKKELNDYFGSPLIYILAGLFNAIVGWLFFNYLVDAKNLTMGAIEFGGDFRCDEEEE